MVIFENDLIFVDMFEQKTKYHFYIHDKNNKNNIKMLVIKK